MASNAHTQDKKTRAGWPRAPTARPPFRGHEWVASGPPQPLPTQELPPQSPSLGKLVLHAGALVFLGEEEGRAALGTPSPGLL